MNVGLNDLDAIRLSLDRAGLISSYDLELKPKFKFEMEFRDELDTVQFFERIYLSGEKGVEKG